MEPEPEFETELEPQGKQSIWQKLSNHNRNGQKKSQNLKEYAIWFCWILNSCLLRIYF